MYLTILSSYIYSLVWNSVLTHNCKKFTLFYDASPDARIPVGVQLAKLLAGGTIQS